MGLSGIGICDLSSAWIGVRVEYRGSIGPLDRYTPATPRWSRRERDGPDLFDIVTPQGPAPDDLPGTLGAADIVDPIGSAADSEQGASAW
jgi:hypothetical protein